MLAVFKATLSANNVTI